MEEKKKNSAIITVFGISLLMIALVGATYAYFRAQGGGTTSRDVSVTSNTTDNLSFTIGNDISFTASEANFYQGGTNISGNATATAMLTPNNKTNQATMNYYMYLNLTSNPTVYSTGNTNHDAELILQVFNGSNQLVTLTGLGDQVALGNGYGYDITGVTGLITLLDNHAITANGSATTENWSVVITLVNLNLDQNDNTNKVITGEIIMSKTPQTTPIVDLMTHTVSNYNASTMATGTTNLLYYHDENLEDGAEDGSYRYAGTNPNNWVCFGSDASTCPAENLYRIIGFMPVDVVTDSTTTPETTERQMLYKLIRNDYETSTTLGLTSNGYVNKCNNQYCIYAGPSGNLPSGNIDGFFWSSPDLIDTENDWSANLSNTWSESTLNTIGLNTTAYGEFSNIWQSKIETVMWKVGGTLPEYTYSATDANTVYLREIVYSGVNIDNEENWDYPSDNKSEIPNKIGMLYISDYVYAQPQSTWTTTDPESPLYNVVNNWLYRGISEWTITRDCWYDWYDVDAIECDGSIQYNVGSYSSFNAVRRSFYLTEDTIIDMSSHAGTLADPYRIS